MKITYGSICSGIEAASVAWESLDWEVTWLSQYDPEHNYKSGMDFPSAVLDYRFPNVENLGDMTKLPDMIRNREIESPDILVGGPPCQSFSYSGLRGGLSDSRGQLTLKYVELLDEIDEIRIRDGKREAIAIYENVPGILSSKDNAFGCLLGALAGESSELQPPRGKWKNSGCVFGPKRTIAWRVLDAQYFGVAQRRRRVFLVASARTDICPTKVLFEFEGVRRDSQPCRKAWEETTRSTAGGSGATGFRKLTFESYTQDETASTMMARDYKSYTDLIVRDKNDIIEGFDLYNNIACTLTTASGQEAANSGPSIMVKSNNTVHNSIYSIAGNIIGGNGTGYDDSGVSYTLTTVDRHGVVSVPSDTHNDPIVRRLTPTECERLQGFPDGWTKIPWRGNNIEDCPDGHRYKALGNSMAVPVMKWIGERLNSLLKESEHES